MRVTATDISDELFFHSATGYSHQGEISSLNLK